MKRTSLSVAVAALLLGACIDTSIPDLSGQLGTGPTDGPVCTPGLLDEGLPPETLRLHFIDVGHGDAIWVQTPWLSDEYTESLNILIDTGSSGNVPGTSHGVGAVVDYLLRYGLELDGDLDALVITHAHEDHYGGVPTLTDLFDVQRYVDPGFTAGSQGFSFARSEVLALSPAFETPAIPSLAATRYLPVDLFGSYLEARLLWSAEVPPSGNTTNPSGTDINNTSVSFSLRWQGRQLLLVGDLEEEVEEILVQDALTGEIDLSSAVLKVGHHGSTSGSTDEFLDQVFPQLDPDPVDRWAVITAGRRTFNGVSLPAESTVDALRDHVGDHHVLSTANRDEDKPVGEEHGDDPIVVTIDPDGQVWACYVL